MFTPPPSPLPPIRQAVDPSDVTQTTNCPIEDTHVTLSKYRFHRSIRLTIVLVPLTLTLIAAFTQFWAHPAIFDLLSVGGDHEWTGWTKVSDWSFHDPHRAVSNHVDQRSTSNPLVARDGTTAIPTVPVNPVLPTPFPQPFDTTLSTNFSTTSCYDFFLNMTQTDAFRSCRPFSLLISTSYAFEQAQKDINLMNTDVWGTCNTNTSQEQCNANMSWFATSLQASCETDLANQVETAVMTLDALYAYDLMRDVACQVDQATNSYCYVEAVGASDPTNYWFYQLPLGQPLGPDVTTNGCNNCTSGLMLSYGSALNGTNGATLSGLMGTYNTAVDKLNTLCGSSYAKVTQTSTSSSGWVNAGVPRISSLVGLAVLLAGVCGSGDWML